MIYGLIFGAQPASLQKKTIHPCVVLLLLSLSLNDFGNLKHKISTNSFFVTPKGQTQYKESTSKENNAYSIL
jgi:hypothetical protein